MMSQTSEKTKNPPTPTIGSTNYSMIAHTIAITQIVQILMVISITLFARMLGPLFRDENYIFLIGIPIVVITLIGITIIKAIYWKLKNKIGFMIGWNLTACIINYFFVYTMPPINNTLDSGDFQTWILMRFDLSLAPLIIFLGIQFLSFIIEFQFLQTLEIWSSSKSQSQKTIMAPILILILFILLMLIPIVSFKMIFLIQISLILIQTAVICSQFYSYRNYLNQLHSFQENRESPVEDLGEKIENNNFPGKFWILFADCLILAVYLIAFINQNLRNFVIPAFINSLPWLVLGIGIGYIMRMVGDKLRSLSCITWFGIISLIIMFHWIIILQDREFAMLGMSLNFTLTGIVIILSLTTMWEVQWTLHRNWLEYFGESFIMLLFIAVLIASGAIKIAFDSDSYEIYLYVTIVLLVVCGCVYFGTKTRLKSAKRS